MGGAGNNPGVRLVEYLRSDGSVVNIRQFYLNLTKANAEPTDWIEAYNAKSFFGLEDMTPTSLKKLVDRMWTDDALFGKYYSINGLFFDPNEKWSQDYRIVHCCAIEELDYSNYTACVDRHTPSAPTSLGASVHRPTIAHRHYAAAAATAAVATIVFGRRGEAARAFFGI